VIDLRSKIREVQDFPTPGVGFKDFTPLLADAQALRETVDPLALELHPDLIPNGSKVIIHDDVLATGGTVEGIMKLVEQLGGVVVGTCFIIELTFLDGRKRLEGTDVHALITY
jgi:adenine/guanine phosphoribosyltransferase-like PRPP-binding protein